MLATMNYQIQANSLRCAGTGRELRPGEKFYSVLFDRGATLERKDFSDEAWQGPPADAYCFWMGHVPEKGAARRLQFDEEVLFDFFQRLADDPEPRKVNFRYILALLLMRKKRLKFEEVRTENEVESLVLRCAKTRKAYTAVNPRLSEEELAAVQDEVQKLLGLT
jgi:hypothetical protein